MAENFDLLTMGRCSIDLYAEQIGAAFVDVKSFGAYVGGSEANIAVGAARLGLRTALLSAVGPDPVGDFIVHFLEKEGVETQYVARKAQGRSNAVLLAVQPPDRFPLVMYRDKAPDALLDSDDVRAAPVERCRAFEFGGNNLSREPAGSAVLFAAGRAEAAGATVFMDLDLRLDQWPDPLVYGAKVRAALPHVDVAIGTEEEVRAVLLREAGQARILDSQVSSPQVEGDLKRAVEAVLGLGPQALVVKRGARGCTVFRPGAEPLDVPGFRVEVLNVLGAGDAFAAGLIYARLRGQDWAEAARTANACGAIVVTRNACANATPTLEEVEEFLGGE